MNYWILTTEYPPFFGGGISTYCYHTACMLSEQGHALTVFVNDRSVENTTIEKLPEARLIRFNPSIAKADAFLGNETAISYAFAWLVKEFIEKEGKPDVIESQDYNGIAYFLLQYKYCLFDWCRDVPVVVTMHSPNFLYMEYNELPLYKQPNYWIGEMERFSIQAADMLLSPSEYLISELKKRFVINNSNLHVLPNPYKAEELIHQPVVHSAILNNDLTFYGKLSPQKGPSKFWKNFRSCGKVDLTSLLQWWADKTLFFHLWVKQWEKLSEKNMKNTSVPVC